MTPYSRAEPLKAAQGCTLATGLTVVVHVSRGLFVVFAVLRPGLR